MKYFGLAIIWMVIAGLLLASLLTEKVPLWVPLLLYVLAVGARIYENVGNYKDWLGINRRDEGLKLQEVANDMANRGLTFSSIRENEEKKVREDFEYKRKRAFRRLVVGTINSFFLV